MKKWMSLILCMLLVVCASAAMADTALGIVTTKNGQMSGVAGDLYEDVTVFKGVPYAQPPVGELRWQPPQDLENWEGVLACDEYAAISPQFAEQGAGSEPYKQDFYWEGFPEISEDCLYMNIWTPATKGDEKLPVYIYFHGGGQRHGWSWEPEFLGEELAKKGIIVITVGQRLGVFGYMAIPQLAEEQNGTCGNYGIMDLAKAYEWIKENIAAFGGNPDNITIGGQSGGTSKSVALELMPGVKVQNMILHSGLKWFDSFSSLESAYSKGQKYLETMGIDPNATLEELRALDTAAFLGDEWEVYKNNTPASIVNDGVYITYSKLADAIAAGEFAGINILSGTTLGEATVKKSAATAEEFYALYKEYLGDKYDKYDFEKLVPVTDETAADTLRTLSSMGMNVGIGATYSRSLMVNRVFGELMAKDDANGNMYSFLFARFTPSKPEEDGTDRDSDVLWAWHSSDLWYFFNTLREGNPPVRDWEEGDIALADLASDYIVNFVTTGNPNGEGLPVWPEADEGLGYMRLDVESQGVTEITELDKLMREVVIDYYDLDL